MTSRYENTFFEYFNGLDRAIRMRPIVLGGSSGDDGGIGGPPGGFIGQLPQSKIAYDTTEAESLETPESGASLVHNLNHIRARISQIVESGNGINVYQDNTLVAQGVTVVKFKDDFTVERPQAGTAEITLLSNGVRSDVTYSGIFGESLTDQIVLSGTNYTTENSFAPGTLAVFVNGVRQSNTAYSTYENNQGFSTNFTLVSGDTLNVDYYIAHSGWFHTHSQYMISGETYTIAQINGLLSIKSDIGHTHVMADITDLDIGNATEIQNVPVSGIGPTDQQVLQFDGDVGSYVPSLLYVKQQFIFTVEGNNLGDVEDLPFRIYAHDVGLFGEITEVFAYVQQPPTTKNLRLNVYKNGVNIFGSPSYLEIPIGSGTGIKTDFSDTTISYNDYFTIGIAQEDPVASDLSLHIRFKYAL